MMLPSAKRCLWAAAANTAWNSWVVLTPEFSVSLRSFAGCSLALGVATAIYVVITEWRDGRL